MCFTLINKWRYSVKYNIVHLNYIGRIKPELMFKKPIWLVYFGIFHFFCQLSKYFSKLFYYIIIFLLYFYYFILLILFYKHYIKIVSWMHTQMLKLKVGGSLLLSINYVYILRGLVLYCILINKGSCKNVKGLHEMTLTSLCMHLWNIQKKYKDQKEKKNFFNFFFSLEISGCLLPFCWQTQACPKIQF